MREIYCANAIEFVNSIGSDVKLVLTGDVYDLSSIEMDYDNNVYFRDLDVTDNSRELRIQGIDNLSIIGQEGKRPRISSNFYWASILVFERSRNIHIENVDIGHYPEFGGCSGGVVAFEECNIIHIDNVQLFGCGTEGIKIISSNNIDVENCNINHCNQYILYSEHSVNAKFIKCTFENNDASMIMLRHVNEYQFIDCIYHNNNPTGYGDVTEDGKAYTFTARDTSGRLEVTDLILNGERISMVSKRGNVEMFADKALP